METRICKNNYFNNKYNTDHIHRFKCNIRTMVRMSFKRKGKMKNKHMEEILGCNTNFLISYLIGTYEKKYNEKWDWAVLKDVHIDHIMPLAIAKDEQEIEKLCHYTNLQLLKAKDNLAKSNKVYI